MTPPNTPLLDLIGKPSRYPDGPGYVASSDTSQAAATSIEPIAGTLRTCGARWATPVLCRRQVLEAIRASGAHGMTDDEAEQALGLRHQTASARRRELVLSGHVADTGERRQTRSGRLATVWAAVLHPRAPEPEPLSQQAAMVAVATGLLARMSVEQLRQALGHLRRIEQGQP